MLDEARLIAAARRMEPEALSAIHERHFDAIYRYVSFRVGDADTAEDLASEVFTRFLTALRQGGGPTETLAGWLYGVAGHVIKDHLRRQYRRPQVPLEASLPAAEADMADAVDQSLRADRLREVVASLTADQQAVLSLRFGAGLPIRDVADSMGKSEGAVKQLQARAVAQLSRLLRPEGVAG